MSMMLFAKNSRTECYRNINSAVIQALKVADSLTDAVNRNQYVFLLFPLNEDVLQVELRYMIGKPRSLCKSTINASASYGLVCNQTFISR